jgi:hypothetical protein
MESLPPSKYMELILIKNKDKVVVIDTTAESLINGLPNVSNV